MDSWTILLLLDVARGRCIAKRQATQSEWLRLWMLVHEAYPTSVLAALGAVEG